MDGARKGQVEHRQISPLNVSSRLWAATATRRLFRWVSESVQYQREAVGMNLNLNLNPN